MSTRAANLEANLIRRLRVRSAPLRPVKTGVRPRVVRIPGLRAVLFDVYGTMLVSASGDVGCARRQGRESALAAAFCAAGMTPLTRNAARLGIIKLDAAIAAAHRAAHRRGIRHPEIDVFRIWSGILKDFVRRKRLIGPVTPAQIQILVVEYESRVNPVWPMPGLQQTLQRLRRSGMVLGIVSNAQFYTPLVLRSFPETGWARGWFDEDACVWSYRLREAKPSPRLFRQALRYLRRRHGIRPEEVLVVGNDLRNDIRPAVAAGCHAALFAGDRRSYRPRLDEPPVAGWVPHLLITSLPQLLRVAGSARHS